MYTLMEQIKDSIYEKQKDVINLCLELKINFTYSSGNDGNNTLLTVNFGEMKEISSKFIKTDSGFYKEEIDNLDIIYKELKKLNDDF